MPTLNRPLPHRAFELKEVIEYNKAILVDYGRNTLRAPMRFLSGTKPSGS
jgi:hypothetical protein